MARQVFDDAELLLAAVLELAPAIAWRAANMPRSSLNCIRTAWRVENSISFSGRSPPTVFTRRSMPPRRWDSASMNAPLDCTGTFCRARRGCRPAPIDRARAEDLGRHDEAIDSYRKAAACRPSFGDAYWSLANLKTYRFTDEEFKRLRAAEAEADTGTIDRYHACLRSQGFGG